MSPPKADLFQILGVPVHRVAFTEALDRVQSFAQEPRLHHLVTANTLMLLAAEKDSVLRTILDQADLVVPESSGVFWASRWMKQPLPGFIPGIDLMNALCDRAAKSGDSVFLLGGKPGVAQEAAEVLVRRYPGLTIAGTHDGYFTDPSAVLGQIEQAQPTYIFVGMNMPQQEHWIHRHRAQLRARVAMGVGGSFDVLSGRLKRAPAIMRKLGLEWVYRTLQEPWRLGRIKDLPVFVWKVVLSTPYNQ